jgi:hypothetical protein
LHSPSLPQVWYAWRRWRFWRQSRTPRSHSLVPWHKFSKVSALVHLL